MIHSPGKMLEAMSLAVGNPGIPSPLVAGVDPFSVLVSTVVSLRTRDAVTEVVSKRVLSRLPSPSEMCTVSTEELSKLLRPAGFFNTKAVQLKRTAEILVNRYDGKVPRQRGALEALPVVGPKTSAMVVSMAFGIPAICVDVHVHRISNRTGIVSTPSPEKTEKALMKMFPRELWIPLNHVFVRFGQRVCLPVKPKCSLCPFERWCSFAD